MKRGRHRFKREAKQSSDEREKTKKPELVHGCAQGRRPMLVTHALASSARGGTWQSLRLRVRVDPWVENSEKNYQKIKKNKKKRFV